MSNSILSNIAALTAQQNIANSSANAASSIARLSSGNRIAKASDDVSGLATGTALRSQVTTLRSALGNATQGTSLLQVADGAVTQIINILQRQKAIATQASSGQLTDANRSLLNQEFTNLTAEIDRISSSTNFNGVALLSGTMGTNTTLERTDALSATATVAAPTLGGANAVASSVSIQAFTTNTGVASVANNTSVLGNINVTDSSGTTLANAAYMSVDTNLVGKFTNFAISNVNYGAANVGTATITATINGSTYTGTVTAGASATAVLQNGNTYIKVGLGTVTLTDSASASNTQANINQGFANTSITKVSVVQGVNFNGTTLNGDIGSTSQFVTARLAQNGSLNVSNFAYVSNTGANTNTLTVQVNGQTFTSTNVKDSLTAGGTLQFTDSTGLQSITINTTGLAAATGNIRTDSAARSAVISALNTGFSQAGGNGLNFSIGTLATDTINVTLAATGTQNLYNGNTLDISTAATAASASAQLDLAITKATSIEASIGALESRFNYASSAIQTSIQNQDSARSQLLDTDVSAESTAYASAQVQTQAGIAVLAQANQLPQALLKLIQ